MAQGDVNITMVGNLVADPELRFVANGAAVCNFRIASTPRRWNAQTNQWEDGEAMFMSCNIWRQAAENVAETLTKGMRVIVTGRMRSRSYQTREGENRTVFEIECDEVGPSLRYASAQVSRNPREGGNNYGGGQPNNQGGYQNGGFQGGDQGGNSGYNQGGFGQRPSQQQSAPADDPWSSAPAAGGGGLDDSNPPF